MKSYSYKVKENPESYAFARIEGVDASFKDLSEVCGRMNQLQVERAAELLQKFSNMEAPVMYKSHNKKLGHRRELGGRKGRYPQKAAKIVLKLLQSAVANAMTKGMIEPYVIVHLSANKKRNLPRMSPKGRRARSDYETSRVEVVIREKVITKKEDRKVEKKQAKEEKKVEAKPQEKKTEKPEVKKEKPVEKKEVKEVKKPAAKKAESKNNDAKKTGGN